MLNVFKDIRQYTYKATVVKNSYYNMDPWLFVVNVVLPDEVILELQVGRELCQQVDAETGAALGQC
jgi:hypothetical protein